VAIGHAPIAGDARNGRQLKSSGDGELKHEMFANSNIRTSDASESPAVPQSAGGL